MIVPLLLAVLMATSVLTTDKYVALEMSPPEVYPGCTPVMVLRCSVNTTSSTTPGMELLGQTPATDANVNALILKKEGVTIATVTYSDSVDSYSPAKSYDNNTNIAVEGSLLGNEEECGFLEVTWTDPMVSLNGTYECVANGLDTVGEQVSFSVTAGVIMEGAGMAQMDALKQHISELEASLTECEAPATAAPTTAAPTTAAPTTAAPTTAAPTTAAPTTATPTTAAPTTSVTPRTPTITVGGGLPTAVDQMVYFLCQPNGTNLEGQPEYYPNFYRDGDLISQYYGPMQMSVNGAVFTCDYMLNGKESSMSEGLTMVVVDICGVYPDGNNIDPTSCSSYYTCAGGQVAAGPITCPNSWFFNEMTGECDEHMTGTYCD